MAGSAGSSTARRVDVGGAGVRPIGARAVHRGRAAHEFTTARPSRQRDRDPDAGRRRQRALGNFRARFGVSCSSRGAARQMSAISAFWAPDGERVANPSPSLAAGHVLAARNVHEKRTLASTGGCASRAGTRSRIRAVPRRTRVRFNVGIANGARPSRVRAPRRQMPGADGIGPPASDEAGDPNRSPPPPSVRARILRRAEGALPLRARVVPSRRCIGTNRRRRGSREPRSLPRCHAPDRSPSSARDRGSGHGAMSPRRPPARSPSPPPDTGRAVRRHVN